MAKIKKKGVSGNAKNFITRTQAVRKLQISLPDFRRLCIFKGIYPREPRNKKKANKGSTAPTTFYYAKDIQYLLHEPVLQKFRDHKVFAKKLQKALGRHEYSDARRLEETQKPRITLDHIVKERYPTFIDALRDLDDALSMLFLFANLPTNHNLPPATVASCQRLCNEWQHYIIRSHSLQKSFLSIKGIYYQAEIQGQDILWLVPYKFAQRVPADVDFRIMHTFVEFYTQLLGFVLFRLYTNLGLVYPPKFDEEADAKGAGLRAFKVESKMSQLPESSETKENSKALASLPDKIKNLVEEDPTAVEDQMQASDDDETTKIDTFAPVATTGIVDVLEQPSANGASTTAADPSAIFSQTTFFLSRETPREPLEFLLRSCGCKRVAWDPILGDGAFTDNEANTSITHQVVDRPPVVALPPGETPQTTTSGRVPGRIYVQPQYVWDCINAGKILPPAEYAPGAMLPPHLSPWVKVREGGYDPQAPVEIDDDGEEEVAEDDNGMKEDLDSGEEESEEEAVAAIKDIEMEEDESEDETQAQYQRELEAEAAGVKPEEKEKKAKEKDKKKKEKKQREEEEMKEMQKIMMPKKKRKLYEKMVYSNNKKDEEAEALRRKRVKIEKEKRKGKVGGK